MKLTFFGGAKMVTGANYLLETDKEKILVDCGLHQGSNYCERHNFEDFPYDPGEIAAVFVTHAHIDHSGRLPKLVRDGFRGAVYSTPPTKAFAEFLLDDSEDILKREAEREKKPPLYTKPDLERLKGLWQSIPYGEEVAVAKGIKAKFHNAGHILGSAFIEVRAEGKTVVFSGDLGNSPAPLIKPLETIHEADYCLVESTYGNRIHEPREKIQEGLEDIVEDTVRAGGALLIPAFAMERTQDLLFHLNKLIEEGRVPKIPIFIDSPLAIKLSNAYSRFRDEFNEETVRFLSAGNELFKFPSLKMTLTTEESKAINGVPPPKVIIAGSGMSQGGRILHHERRYLSDPKSTILFIGYQAKGSLGRRILEGAPTVKIFGEEILVRARKAEVHGYSAHADQSQILNWLSEMRLHLKKVFVVQGEEEEALPLAQKIRDILAVGAEVPELNEAADF